MKNFKIFCKAFLVCLIIGMTIECGFYVFAANHSTKFIWLYIVEELAADTVLAGVTVLFCKTKQITVNKNIAMRILQRNASLIEEQDGILLGKLSKWKGFFMENITYNEKTNYLSGPSYLLKL